MAQKKKRRWIIIDGFKVLVGSKLWKWIVKFLKKHKAKPKPAPIPPTPKPKPKPEPIVMYDDVNITLIPANAPAVAGYVGGKWPTYPELVKKFPKALKLSIAISASEDADCLDVEPGDATIAEAPAWIKRQHKRGIKRVPVLYTSASWGQKLINACTQAGLKYGVDYLWWSAHYDPSLGRHFCGPTCGFGIKRKAHATQWTDKADNKSLDESVCSAKFFK